MSFQIVRNDIVNMKVDAVVNSANPQAQVGAGVDSAIYRKAGTFRLLAARRKIGKLQPGQAAATPGFGLPAEYIIHTVGPVWRDGMQGEERLLRSCYQESLRIAAELGCESVAFPMISTGTYGFPRDRALQTAVSAISEFLMHHEMKVYLVVFDRKSFELSGKLFENVDVFIDEKYVSDAERRKYEMFRTERDSRSESEESAILSADIPESEEEPELRRKRSPFSERADNSAVLPTHLKKINKPAGLPPLFESDSPVEVPPFPARSGRAAGLSSCMESSECAMAQMAEEKESKAPAEKKRVRSLEDLISQVGETFSQCLFRLIDEKGKTDVEVYKKANLDRKLFSKIRSNEKYQPGKKTVLALAVALELNLDETKDFLGKAGLAFSPGSISDLIIQYFIMNEVYDIYQINLSLFDHDQPTLG